MSLAVVPVIWIALYFAFCLVALAGMVGLILELLRKFRG